MIIDGVSLRTIDGGSPYSKAVASFLSFIEKKLGATIMKDLRTVPYGRDDLFEPLLLAKTLLDRTIITSYEKPTQYPDEPRMYRWGATCNSSAAPQPTGGASFLSDKDALMAALAESLERYLWTEARDHFESPLRATVAEMEKKGPYIAPERFVAFSDTQRETRPDLTLTPDARYLWTRGTSLVSGKKIYVPAQTASGVRGLRTDNGYTEPFIRISITTGLATWPEPTQARLSGALEVIERDAYMITWLNQITPPRLDLVALSKEDPELRDLIAMCERYRIKIHGLRLITDAPTYAVAAVLEDESGIAPRFAIGLKAHNSPSHAVKQAVLEAMRARYAQRYQEIAEKKWDPQTPVDAIGHRDRLYYWAMPEHAKKLEFLIHGPVETRRKEEWEHDSISQHLARIVGWCKEQAYECIVVSLGRSKLNPMPWYVEVVILPDLQPTYLKEELRQTSGARLTNVPKKMGYKARETSFTEAPHPFS